MLQWSPFCSCRQYWRRKFPPPFLALFFPSSRACLLFVPPCFPTFARGLANDLRLCIHAWDTLFLLRYREKVYQSLRWKIRDVCSSMQSREVCNGVPNKVWTALDSHGSPIFWATLLFCTLHQPQIFCAVLGDLKSALLGQFFFRWSTTP